MKYRRLENYRRGIDLIAHPEAQAHSRIADLMYLDVNHSVLERIQSPLIDRNVRDFLCESLEERLRKCKVSSHASV